MKWKSVPKNIRVKRSEEESKWMDSSSAVFAAKSLVFTMFGKIFACLTLLYNPVMEMIDFRLNGWCVLSVFLLLASTCLRHERQNLIQFVR